MYILSDMNTFFQVLGEMAVVFSSDLYQPLLLLDLVTILDIRLVLGCRFSDVHHFLHFFVFFYA